MKPLRLMLDVRMLGLSVFLLLAVSVAGQQLDQLVIDDELDGPNVCKEVDQYQLFVTAPREVTYQERYQKWCVAVPPRCSAYRVKTKTVNETTSVTKERILKKCCAGYEKNQQGDRCVPACSNGCKHGVCIAPEICRCNEGYAGKTCNINCPPNRWGSDCNQKCQCKNNSTCNAQDGSCACQKGYTGEWCEYQCQSDRFGQDCAEICQCQSGGKCDPVSGECYCAPGFAGPLCAERCPEGKHGEQCRSDCRCQNGGSCDSQTGECICPAGYTGSVCANRCQGQRYGLRCEQKCECFNGADCNHVTGECICAPGFMGSKCLDSCPHNTYGYNCTETCRCLNGAVCDMATGKCSCAAGWMGADCGLRICPDDRFGGNCTGQCECDVNNTKICHPWTGKCLCKPGWSSTLCDRPCPFLRYGQDCLIHCNCKNNSPCNHIDGTCNCIAGYKGDNCEEQCSNGTYGQNCSQRCECMNGATCSPESGQCFCAPGWQGIRCDRPCDTLHYGKDCTERCNCTNNGVCNPVNGQCTCPAGWTGERCDKKCESGRFGQNCSQKCDCSLEHTLACNATTGKCICKADWGGVRCEGICPMGYYGESCNEICTCHNNSSCDPISGECICSRGWTGPTCNEPCPDGFFGHGCKERCPVSNTTCDHITGKYSCRPGYIGTTCEHPCPSGTYGNECRHSCTCKNGGECSHETGTCQCPPGWTGANCEEVCPNGFYGVNCNQKCNCKNKAKCRKNDGQCICDPGWMGNRCDEVCPEGFYGNHCMESCNCPPGNFACHAARGCVCSVGYYGDKCDKSRAEAKVQASEDNVTNNDLGSQSVKVNQQLETTTYFTQASDYKPNSNIDRTETTTLCLDWKLPSEDNDLLDADPSSKGVDFDHLMDDYIHLSDEPHNYSRFDGNQELEANDETSFQNSNEDVESTTLRFDWEMQSEDDGFLGTYSTPEGENVGHPLDDYIHLPDEPRNDYDIHLIVTADTPPSNQYATTQFKWKIQSEDETFLDTKPTQKEEDLGHPLGDYIHLPDEPYNDSQVILATTRSPNQPEINQDTTALHFDWKLQSEDDNFLITDPSPEGEDFGHPLDDYIHLPDEPHNDSQVELLTTRSSNQPEVNQDTTKLLFDWKQESEDDSFLITDPTPEGEDFGHPLDDYIHLQDEPHNDSQFMPTTTRSPHQTEINQDFTTLHYDWKLQSDDDNLRTTDPSSEGEDFNHPLDDYIHLPDEPHNDTQQSNNAETTTLYFDWNLQSEDDFLKADPIPEVEDYGHPLNDYIHLLDKPHDGNFTPDERELSTVASKEEEVTTHTLDDYYHIQLPGEISSNGDFENNTDLMEDDVSLRGGNFSAIVRGRNNTAKAEKVFASNAGLAWGLVLAVIFVGVIIALVLYYRRRVANLKAEVNHVVNYMIQEQPGHFDNPVYSAYQNQPASAGGSGGQPNGIRPMTHDSNGLLSNGSLIRNNLRNPKSNLDKYRYPENESVGTDRSYSIQFLSESQKNFDADMTNPNYDVKDHVYDEIKHKDGYKDLDTEYDHLDYSRAGSSHKTHYFRMNNPLTNSPKEINVLRENGTINNLSSPGLSSRQPLVHSGLGTTTATGTTDYGSSSSNSSPIPPPLCTNGTDSSNLLVKTSSEGSFPAVSDQECSSSNKIPEHQLNIK